MPIYLGGGTFQNRFVTPANDGAVWETYVSDGIAIGCALSYTGTTLRIGAGKMIFGGRVVIVPGQTDIPVTGATSGYARVVITIDLSKTATKTAFEQAALDVQYATSINGFPALTKEAINNGGTLYKAEVCLMTLSAAGISGIVRRAYAHAKGRTMTVTLPARGWDSNTKNTVAADILASDNVVATYAPASHDAWTDAGIYLLSQVDGSLTFKAAGAPSADVTANIILL